MHVIFVEPGFPHNQREFVRGLHAVGALVTGIGEAPVSALGDQLRSWLHGYEQVRSVVHEPSLFEAVRRIQNRGPWVHRLEATVEAHVMAAAKVREACKIPGTSVRTAFLCRDKPAMKEELRKGGIPCAASCGTSDADEARAFAERVGFPLIIKPRAAAGASGTYKANDAKELEEILQATGVVVGHEVAIEEFIEGHEGFYDTLCIDGEVVHEFASHYYPGVLEAMRTRWISPQIVTTNRLDEPSYQEVASMARKVNKILDIGTSATHMEWFFGPKGLKFSEIGCRPPGVGAWDLYCAAHEIDLYREWGAAVALGKVLERRSRKYAAGMIALRPSCDGIIVGYEGVDKMRHQLKDLLIDDHFPAPGTPTQPVAAGYMANAWVRLRHESYDTLREIMTRIGEQVKVHARPS